jgi:arginase
MRPIGLLGVPANSSGRVDGVARGPTALRSAGLVDALGELGDIRDYGDVSLPAPTPERDPDIHLIDPVGFVAVITRVRDAVTAILDDGYFPLVVGGDCPLLLGCLLAARADDGVRLLFADGHEDGYTPERSTTGEAADMELAFALGLADATWSPELAAAMPVVSPADVRILGARDAAILQSEGVPTLADRVATVDGDLLLSDPSGDEEGAFVAGRAVVVPPRSRRALHASAAGGGLSTAGRSRMGRTRARGHDGARG